MLKKFLSTLAIFIMSASASWAQNCLLPIDYPQKGDPSEFMAIIEIPQGGAVKYEIEADTGYLLVDRFQSMPVAYPANYGFIPGTLSGDQDPLDVLVYTRAPIAPGAVVKVRPLGVLKMIDGGEMDDKIVAVPAGKIDPTYEGIKSLDDLPEMEAERLKAFFRVYKDLPAGGKIIELKGFGDLEAAREIIAKSFSSYKEVKEHKN